jgi:hypothetical protein
LKREIEILADVQHPHLIRMLAHDKSSAPRNDALGFPSIAFSSDAREVRAAGDELAVIVVEGGRVEGGRVEGGRVEGGRVEGGQHAETSSNRRARANHAIAVLDGARSAAALHSECSDRASRAADPG